MNTEGFPAGELISPNVRKNIYRDTHNYATTGTYTLSFQGTNRIGGCLNINSPNSEQVPMALQTQFTLSNEPNEGPVFSGELVDFVVVGQPYTCNHGATDVDGDSFNYVLTMPLQSLDSPVPNFLSPEMIDPGPDNTLTLNLETGTLVWDAAQIPGVYNIAFEVTTYRNGEEVDRTVRELQLIVETMTTNIPDFQTEVPQVKAYPNPASGAFLYLDTSNLPNEITSCQLFNVQGQFMGAFVLDPQDARVSIATLPKGVYFLKGADRALDWSVSFIKE